MITEVLFGLSALLLAIAIVLTFVRILRGPSLADRVVGFDLLAAAAIGLIVIAAIQYNEPVFIDVALILALMAFVSTVAFAHYLQRKEGEE